MAGNVFGTPITDVTLKALPEYVGKEITRKDRAMVAREWIDSENKSERVQVFVEGLKSQWGTGVSTPCMVYNATGDPITFVTSKEWYGSIGPSPYPGTIANGQWGGFLHVNRSIVPGGSVAAVVYPFTENAGQQRDWMFAWSNPWSKVFYSNHTYTEIREADHVPQHWDYIHGLLSESGPRHADTWKKSVIPSGSEAAVVYRGMDNAGQQHDWMFAWSNPWNKVFYSNHVYTEIREADHFPQHWDYIHGLLLESGLRHTDTWNACQSSVAIGEGTSHKFEAMLTLAS